MNLGAVDGERSALGLLAAAIGLLLCGCGGRSTKEDATAAPGMTAGGPSTSGEGRDDGALAAPTSTVSESGSDQGLTDANATPECLQGFQGFNAMLGDQSVDFKAFVSAPGDYAGDAIHILWLSVTQPDGSRYLASTGAANAAGKMSLHVDTVDPRFDGTLTAVLPNQNDASAPPLRLHLSFDIAVRAGCT